MTRGRKRQPTAVAERRGNPRKRSKATREQLREVELAMPEPATVPDPPIWLPTEAKRVWRKLAEPLVMAKVLKATDLYTLECACLSYARMRQAELEIDVHGLTIEQETRYGVRTVSNPAVAISNKERANWRAFMSELGLSPAARARLEFKAPGDDPLQGLMQQALNAG